MERYGFIDPQIKSVHNRYRDQLIGINPIQKLLAQIIIGSVLVYDFWTLPPNPLHCIKEKFSI